MTDFLQDILQLMLIVSFVIVFVKGLSIITDHRIGYQWRKLLWLVLALRLLIPVNISLDQIGGQLSKYMIQITIPVSTAARNLTAPEAEFVNSPAEENAGGNDGSLPRSEAGEIQLIQDHTPVSSHANKFQEEKTITKASFSFEQIWCICWIGITALLFCYRLLQYHCVKKKLIRHATPYHFADIQDLKNRLLSEYNIHYRVPVLMNPEIKSPMLFGYGKPVILLPQTAYQEAELEMVLRHELTHLKSGDIWYKLLILLVCDIYWFNPLLLLMKKMAYQDVEYVCDKKVTDKLEWDEKTFYGRVMLATANPGRRKEAFFNTQFTGGKEVLKKRLAYIFSKSKYRYGYAVLVIVLVASSAGMLFFNITTDSKVEDTDSNVKDMDLIPTSETESAYDESAAEIPVTQEQPFTEEPVPTAITFAVSSLDNVFIGEPFLLENYYITRREIHGNIFYIDEDQVLWGCGINDYGQLGNGTVSPEISTDYTNVTKIAEKVISVDISWNGYFCIYLTSDGKLYGMGSNLIGVLGQEETRKRYSIYDYISVTTPVLLMEDVAYARAGRYSIVALKNDGSVWWWGEYKTTSSTKYYPSILGYYWQPEESESNPRKMMYTSPVKILEDCIYVTTGDYMGAAITKNGDLYTWGSNIFGQCGVTVSEEDDFVRKPQKVLENVKMVWPQNIMFNSPEGIADYYLNVNYIYNTFVELTDGTIMVCGENVGDKMKQTAVSGDLVQTCDHIYSDTFLPVELTAY